MSNAYLLTSDQNLPPDVPIEFVTDSGTATAALNTIYVNGGGGIATSAPGNSNQIVVTFSETTETGTGTTIDTATATLITITPPDLKSFSVQGLVTGYDAINNEMIGGEIIANGRKNGTVSMVGVPDVTRDVDAGLNSAVFNIQASGASFVLIVLGVSGRTISWRGVINYIVSP